MIKTDYLNTEGNVKNKQSNEKLNYSQIASEALKEMNKILKTEIITKENNLTEASNEKPSGKKMYYMKENNNNYKGKSSYLDDHLIENENNNKNHINLNKNSNNIIQNNVQNPIKNIQNELPIYTPNVPPIAPIIRDLRYKPVIYNNSKPNKSNLININSPSKIE